MKNRMRLNVNNLISAIKKKRVKKSDLASDIGVTRETLSRWLAGKTAYIEEARLLRMSEVLECEASFLSPEATRSPSVMTPAVASQALLKGDELVRLSLLSGGWYEIQTLYNHSSFPGIVEDAQVNIPLLQILGSLIAMDFSQFDQARFLKDPLLRKHELFDNIARYALVDGILALAAGDLTGAQRFFKKVLIHGQTEWLLSFASLMSGVSCGILGTFEETQSVLRKALQVFGEGKDELTLFSLANIHLILCGLACSGQHENARLHLDSARRIFEKGGFRHGHVRCEAYEALILAYEQDLSQAQAKLNGIEGHIRLVPRLYQTEMLAICARTSYLIGNAPAVAQFMEAADECASNFPVFSILVKKQWLDLDPHNTEVARSREALRVKLQAHG